MAIVKNKTLFKLCSLFSGIIVGLFLMELASAIIIKTNKIDKKLKYIEDNINEVEQANIGQHDVDLGWSFIPKSSKDVFTYDFTANYSINSFGFRDKEFALDKPEWKFRIIALGDSYVFGWGVDYGKRFTEVIEQALDNTEVMNMGVWGFGIDQCFLQLKRDGFRFKPNLVILFIDDALLNKARLIFFGWYKPIFLMNKKSKEFILLDLNLLEKNFAMEKRENDQPKIAKEKIFYLKESNLLTLMNYLLKYSGIKERQKAQNKWFWDNMCIEHINTREKCYKETQDKASLLGKDLEVVYPEVISHILKNYKDICDKNHVDFLVVNIFPKKFSFLTDYCHNLGIDYLDLANTIEFYSQEHVLGFDIDPHYNCFTNRIIGEYLSRFLKEKYKLISNPKYIYKIKDNYRSDESKVYP